MLKRKYGKLRTKKHTRNKRERYTTCKQLIIHVLLVNIVQDMAETRAKTHQETRVSEKTTVTNRLAG